MYSLVLGSCFLSDDCFFKSHFSKITTRVSNSFEPYKARQFVGLDLVLTVRKVNQQTTVVGKTLSYILG